MVIFENESFIVDYNPNTRLMRVSYFEDYHYKDEATFLFTPRCIDCKYVNKKGECTHPNESYCLHGEMWWPKNSKVDK